MPIYAPQSGTTQTFRKISDVLKNSLEQCGIDIYDMGNTFQSDHLQSNGQVAMSLLDHVYHSKSITDRINVNIFSPNRTMIGVNHLFVLKF